MSQYMYTSFAPVPPILSRIESTRPKTATATLTPNKSKQQQQPHTACCNYRYYYHYHYYHYYYSCICHYNSVNNINKTPRCRPRRRRTTHPVFLFFVLLLKGQPGGFFAHTVAPTIIKQFSLWSAAAPAAPPPPRNPSQAYPHIVIVLGVTLLTRDLAHTHVNDPLDCVAH
ncbi:methyltransferase domain-containing protein [Colletotrichum scovillei]|uniref:methyltransferase domain-containing protein n=1 Tax=Colletotrichum scovillei TaxID=1209932 RepID=UPI0015C33506|nr:methyltransferase domain-containing protein [Colletotrichum scovillei]KAF4786068.1 methyltransferase domain-containing protein [Colletotrichum scovillei]